MESRPPVTRNTHLLPFLSLSPFEFERLCLGLVRRMGYERVEHWGATGRDDGVDILAFQDGRRVIFQCKRYEKLRPRDAEAVVSAILALPGEEWPDVLILLATCTVSPETRRRARARAGSIAFEVWALTELDDRVQQYPDLVSLFFDLPQRPLLSEAASYGGVTAVPRRPPHFLPRPEDLAAIKDKLLAGQAVGVQGMGGIGKSVLAAAVALDEEVVAAFTDGIFWVAVGQRPDLVRLQVDLAVAAEEPRPIIDSSPLGKLLLSRIFARKSVLLILDDVWNVQHATALDVLGQHGRLLITTRDAELLVQIGAEEHRVETLAPDQALLLLESWAGEPAAHLPTAREVARECGYLPLALAMIGAMVRLKPTGWSDALDRLKRADLEKIHRELRDYPYPNLFRALGVSVDALEAAERSRYLELAVFPEDVSIPESAIETLWAAAGLSGADSRDLAEKLVSRSLAQRDRNGRLRLHDLQGDYLRHQAEDLPRLHGQLVEAYSTRSPRGLASGPNDGYFFEHIVHHLRDAGRLPELRTLLFDFAWIEAKLTATDINALLADGRVVAGYYSGSLEVWDIASEVIVREERFADGQIRYIEALADGRIVFASDQDGTSRCVLHVWDLTSDGYQRLETLDYIRGLAGLSHGRVAFTLHDGTVGVWDLHSNEVIARLTLEVMPTALAVAGETIVVGDSMGHLHSLLFENSPSAALEAS